MESIGIPAMRERCFLIFFLLCLLSLALHAPALADESDEEEPAVEEIKIDEMVVTATRTEKDVDSAPGNVTVITRKSMELKNIHSVKDALFNESGYYDGKLRGVPDPQHTLVMVNGMPLNTGWRGHVRWENIATDNV